MFVLISLLLLCFVSNYGNPNTLPKEIGRHGGKENEIAYLC